MVYGITENEAKVMDFLVRYFGERNSINQIGKLLKFSPMGIYKILKNLEAMKAVRAEKIGNAIYYRANLKDEDGKALAAYVLSHQEMNSYARVYAQDFKEKLGDSVQAIVLFGSILEKGKDAQDVDVLIIFEKDKYKEVHKKLEEIKELSSKKIHDLMMGPNDLGDNLQKGNKAMIDLIQKGAILKGAHSIVEAIEHGSRGQQA